MINKVDELEKYKPICDIIALVMPGHIEVVLHDLRTAKIVHISNAFSNRNVGDDSLIDSAELQSLSTRVQIIGPYLKSNWDGEKLKSLTAVLRDDSDIAVGLLCINLAMGSIEAIIGMLSSICGNDADPKSRPLVHNDWRDATNDIVRDVLKSRQLKLSHAKRADRLEILGAIEAAGIFQIRGAADYVAKVLSISRASLYASLKYIRQNSTARDDR